MYDQHYPHYPQRQVQPAQPSVKAGYEGVAPVSRLLLTITWVTGIFNTLDSILNITSFWTAGVAVGRIAIGAAIYDFIEHIAKLIDVRHLLATEDQAQLRANIREGHRLLKDIKPYENYNEMPPALQQAIREYFLANHGNVDRMKIAVERSEKVLKQRQIEEARKLKLEKQRKKQESPRSGRPELPKLPGKPELPRLPASSKQ